MNLLISLSLFTSFLSLYYLDNQPEKEWIEVLKINKTVNHITTDRLGNLYLINNNHIWLYNNKGDSIAAFNSRKYGQISYVDASDPYKILIFFQDYSLILFLDNYLSENGEPIDLQELGFDRVTMACLSREKGFWVFDQLRQKVFHLNDNFKVTHETVNLSQWFDKSVQADNLLEYNNQLFLGNSDGIYVFDHFGTYINKHLLKDIGRVQLLDKRVLYSDSSSFCSYNLVTFNSDCENLPVNNVINARMEKDRLYVLSQESVSIFKLN